jgi:cellulose biosynthesis protein BcsQ
MLIVVANSKGGQGKTVIATMLIAFIRDRLQDKDKEKVIGCDLDRTQQNFTGNLKENGIPVKSLDDIPGGAICVVDTPPSISEEVVGVIRRADLLVVPVVLGRYSVEGMLRVAGIRGVKSDLRIIINEWEESAVQKQAKAYLEEHGFNIVGSIKKYRRLAYNMDAGLRWFSGFHSAQIGKIAEVLDRLLSETGLLSKSGR